MFYTITDFNNLQLHQKAVFLEKQASFLLNLCEKDFTYSLYSYRSFYIEVLIDTKTESLVDIVAFGNWNRLDKYCDNIILMGPIY